MGFSLGKTLGLGALGGSMASSGGLLSGLFGKSPDEQTMTTVNSPWGPQQPFLTFGFDEAKKLYSNPASLTPDFSQDTLNALGLQRQRALSGSPLIQSAQDNLQGTVNGDYLYGGQGFNAALDAASRRILPQVNSVFARSGRAGSGLAQTAQTQALADAFASQYGQERNNQMQAISMAPTLASQDYSDIAALKDVGSTQDALAQQRAMEPWQKLQMYQSAINGNYGGTSTQSTPLYKNPLSGALGGGLAGFQMGGPWGAGIGAGLGLLASR